ncbi:hypothetical protein C8R31_101800 [Nitrosospira sp. Nsp2]|uniref:hypothetical protein n=2 Tax=unclassified Nitrosospira TaxID=2609267 RepID=UPI000D4C7D21|nr:hypothetical protein [Nitrosospira sp. Nsp2]PTR17633.1 hypothetical protein C8R31_101800 [Nitrosospira sp. Nsp2]
MPRFAIYVRTEDGTIWRHHEIAHQLPGFLDHPYVHEEALVGWPEAKVLWAEETGPTMGLAPVD